jgi:DNA-binding transcriptional ArsR family regulator
LTETDDYDLIFAALKNPTRRQILLLLEQKGEASFTDIQNALNLTDTGLLSYHLKELGILVEQSSRGKYSLSEIGQTSMTLFNKVEKDKERTSKMVQKEIDSYVSRYFWKSVFLTGLIIINWCIALTVDISVSVHAITGDISLGQLAGFQVAGFGGMILGLLLFVVYDRHYSKKQKTNIIHVTAFAVGISLLTLFSFSLNYNFAQTSLEFAATTGNSGLQGLNQWMLAVILRTAAYLATAPLIAHAVNKLSKRR